MRVLECMLARKRNDVTNESEASCCHCKCPSVAAVSVGYDDVDGDDDHGDSMRFFGVNHGRRQ